MYTGSRGEERTGQPLKRNNHHLGKESEKNRGAETDESVWGEDNLQLFCAQN